MKFQISPIFDKSLWERYNLSSPFPSLFQSWNMGEVERKCGIKVERLGFYKENKLIGIAQVFEIRSRRGHFLHIRGGPVMKNFNDFYGILPLLKDYLKKYNAWFIRISPPILVNDNLSSLILRKLGFRNSPIPFLDAEVSWILDINKDEKTLLSQMRKTTRYLIRKAQKMGILVTQSQNEEAIKDLLKLYNQMIKEKGIVGHRGILEEFREMVKDNQTTVFRGYYQKKLLGSALIIFYGDEAIYHHSAHLRTKEDIPVSYLMQWEIIREAKRRGKKRYNFWGIEPFQNPNHPWYGLTHFKKGFGGYQRHFTRSKDFPLSPSYGFTWLIETIRRIKRYRILL